MMIVTTIDVRGSLWATISGSYVQMDMASWANSISIIAVFVQTAAQS